MAVTATIRNLASGEIREVRTPSTSPDARRRPTMLPDVESLTSETVVAPEDEPHTGRSPASPATRPVLASPGRGDLRRRAFERRSPPRARASSERLPTSDRLTDSAVSRRHRRTRPACRRPVGSVVVGESLTKKSRAFVAVDGLSFGVCAMTAARCSPDVECAGILLVGGLSRRLDRRRRWRGSRARPWRSGRGESF